MIKDYFILQIKMMTRKMKEIGLPPVIGVLLAIVAFIGASFILYTKSTYASPIYVLMALIFVLKLDSMERNSFLKQVFKLKDYYILRISENLLLIFPFVLVLLIQQEFVFSILLSLIAFLLSFISINLNSSFVIPTPFSKKPYELMVGFRNWFYLLALDYFFAIMAIKYENYNLGLFAIIFLFILLISSYTKPENEYFVWNYSLKPGRFIFNKTSQATFQATILILPVLIALFIGFSNQIGNTVIFSVLAYIFLFSAILAKYASYPYEMQLPYMVLIVLSVFFPPFLMVLIPFLYWKASQHLKYYLI
jgi:hypothetical protein